MSAVDVKSVRHSAGDEGKVRSVAAWRLAQFFLTPLLFNTDESTEPVPATTWPYAIFRDFFLRNLGMWQNAKFGDIFAKFRGRSEIWERTQVAALVFGCSLMMQVVMALQPAGGRNKCRIG